VGSMLDDLSEDGASLIHRLSCAREGQQDGPGPPLNSNRSRSEDGTKHNIASIYNHGPSS
jgi:hypothetical protein